MEDSAYRGSMVDRNHDTSCQPRSEDGLNEGRPVRKEDKHTLAFANSIACQSGRKTFRTLA